MIALPDVHMCVHLFVCQTPNYKHESAEKPLEIHIVLNKEKNTITVQDFGIGMTAEELTSNLGTIARSGSKIYKELAKSGNLANAGASASNVIGQFGVGFYSTFMVGHKVEVYSKSAAHPEEPAHYWVSDGYGRDCRARARRSDRLLCLIRLLLLFILLLLRWPSAPCLCLSVRPDRDRLR
jgi:hypothetical protein